MTTTRARLIKLNNNDNVAVASSEISSGAILTPQSLTALNEIPAGHKIALSFIPKDQPIIKYNQIIGFANSDITPGSHVHTHNVYVEGFKRDHAISQDLKPTQLIPIKDIATFDGIIRPDGRIATRNYIGVLTTVNCSATVAKYIADLFRRIPEQFPNVDGVVALTHAYGCGMNAKGKGLELLQNTIAGYAVHPNFAGVLIVGLGCETNQIDYLLEGTSLTLSETVRAMTIQESGGTSATIKAGESQIFEMLEIANDTKRVPVPASHLVLGLECGGSDAYSGISANPALGKASDLLIQNGGTSILGETPEIYGAEHLLTRRAADKNVGKKLLDFVHWWEDYTSRNGGEMDNNPSPGNKDGGLTTIYEKSLGAVAKGGTSNLVDVLDYAEQVKKSGFNFMNTPGYDPVSVTGMVAGGANIVCFTTGRGSVFGCKPVPSLKLATNSKMYESMKDDMDINLGTILEGESIEDAGERLFNLILSTASGKATKSEELGFGDEEFTPWQLGAVM